MTVALCFYFVLRQAINPLMLMQSRSCGAVCVSIFGTGGGDRWKNV
jgi:hypothetical protein